MYVYMWVGVSVPGQFISIIIVSRIELTESIIRIMGISRLNVLGLMSGFRRDVEIYALLVNSDHTTPHISQKSANLNVLGV
jgi:hypothetical protein